MQFSNCFDFFPILSFNSIDKEAVCEYSFETCCFDSLASVAQSAERNHGKVEVCGSIPHEGFNTESGFIKRNCFFRRIYYGKQEKGCS